jgi:hypothetical protein
MSEWVYSMDRLPSEHDGNAVIGFDGYNFEVVHTKYHCFKDMDKKDYVHSFMAFGNCPFKLKAWKRIDAPDASVHFGNAI